VDGELCVFYVSFAGLGLGLEGAGLGFGTADLNYKTARTTPNRQHIFIDW